MAQWVEPVSNNNGGAVPKIEALGRSWDSALGEGRPNVIMGTAETETVFPGDDVIQWSLVTSQREFSRQTSASASGRGSFSFGRARASASVKRFFSTNSYSCYVLAVVRMHRARYYLDLNTVSVAPGVKEFISANQERPDEVERMYGDEVITGVSPGADLIVRMEIQTSSEAQLKASTAAISAAFSGGSAKGSFAKAQGSISSAKKITFSAFGTLDGQVLEGLTLEAAEKLVLGFGQSSRGKERVVEYQTRSLRDIPGLQGYPFINFRELEQRRRFVAAAEVAYADLQDWEADAEYVTANRSEFAPPTIDTALRDLQDCRGQMRRIEDALSDARGHWLDTGTNGSAFDPSRLSLSGLKEYPRLEPARPTPQPKPRPRRDLPEVSGRAEPGGRG